MIWLRRLVVSSLLWTAVLTVQAQDRVSPSAIDLRMSLPMDKLITQLASQRVVFVGESHDRYDHHLNQLEILRRLFELDPGLVLGVEYFQQPFQTQVDDYIAGKTTEKQFLQTTEYYKRWSYDYRLYAPIFRFAREKKIPVRALNVPAELAGAVSRSGVAALPETQRTYLPKEIVPADEAYKNRLRAAFEGHGAMKPEAFDHFVEAQLVWDEGMAESAAAYLNANPGRRMLILAGSGHMVFGTGIPKRLERRTKASSAVVLDAGEDLEPGMADYVLLTKEQTLPPVGVMGVSLEDKDGCRIKSLSPGGAAEKAGLKKGDYLEEVAGVKIQTGAEAPLQLWESKPGDKVEISARRKHRTWKLQLELAAPPKMPLEGR